MANLEAATTYSIYLKAYSALGGSQQSSTITATTQGGGRFHSFYLLRILSTLGLVFYM